MAGRNSKSQLAVLCFRTKWLLVYKGPLGMESRQGHAFDRRGKTSQKQNTFPQGAWEAEAPNTYPSFPAEVDVVPKELNEREHLKTLQFGFEGRCHGCLP